MPIAIIWHPRSAAAGSLDDFIDSLARFVSFLAALPRTRDPRSCPRVVVKGDFFTRFHPFFMEGVWDLYAAKGVILKPVDLADLLLYGTYDGLAEAAHSWGMKPGKLALAKACTRILQPDGQQFLCNWLAYQAERRVEQHHRGIFSRSGFLVAGENNVACLFDRAAKHMSPTILGEAIPPRWERDWRPRPRDTTASFSSARSTACPTGSRRPSFGRTACGEAYPC
ncbi:MAG: hypothetical protein WCA95_01855 [Opitutaceae bacterium]